MPPAIIARGGVSPSSHKNWFFQIWALDPQINPNFPKFLGVRNS